MSEGNAGKISRRNFMKGAAAAGAIAATTAASAGVADRIPMLFEDSPDGLAERLKRELEELEISEGPLAGTPLSLMPWQGEVVDGFAHHRQTFFSIARSNGKTAFVAGIARSALQPGKALYRPRGQIVIAASSLDQGSIAFDHIKFFMRDVLFVDGDVGGKINPEWRIIDNTHQKRIEHRKSGTSLRVIGSDADRAHGKAPSLIIVDEPAKWKNRGKKLWVALRTSMGKQKDCKMLGIGTHPESPLHWFSELLRTPNRHRWVRTYQASMQDIEDGNEFELATIRKANPSYDYLEPLRDEIETAIEEAQNEGGTALTSYRALVLNLGTAETDEDEMLVELENWYAVIRSKGHAAPREGPVAIGIDLGGGYSMSAISFYWPNTGRLEAYGAFPAQPSLLERGRRDGVGEAYQVMHTRGEVAVYPGYKTDNVRFLKDRLSEIEEFDWIGCAADNYAKTDVMQVFLEAHYNEALLDFRRVGAGPHGKEDVEAFQSEVLTSYMSLEQNNALDYAILKSRLRRDPNGNPAIQKATNKGKIDVLQASLLAVGMGYRFRKPHEQKGGLNEFWRQMLESGKRMVGSV